MFIVRSHVVCLVAWLLIESEAGKKHLCLPFGDVLSTSALVINDCILGKKTKCVEHHDCIPQFTIMGCCFKVVSGVSYFSSGTIWFELWELRIN